jgi:hypothetical protein
VTSPGSWTRCSAATRGQRPLGAEQQEIYAGASRDGETLIGGAVRHDDIVVISDPFVAVLAEAVRERGALVVWQLELCPRRAAVARAWSFIERASPPIDAYVTSWSTPLPGGRVQSGVAAFIAGADTVAAKEQKTAAGDPPWDEKLGWSRLLGDIVRAGREEHVGGIVPRATGDRGALSAGWLTVEPLVADRSTLTPARCALPATYAGV